MKTSAPTDQFSPLDETHRLAVLRRYAVLDTPPEEGLNILAELAAMTCEAPIAMISLVDDKRQWFKAKVGLEETETPREDSFCAHALQQSELLTVPDATRDERFAKSALVTGELGIRFYAGAPLVTPDHAVLGTLCVMDREARTLTPQQAQALQLLGRQVMAHFELQRQMACEQKQSIAELRERNTLLQSYAEHSPAAIVMLDNDLRYRLVSQQWKEYFGLGDRNLIGLCHCDVFPAISSRLGEMLRRGLAGAIEACDEDTLVRSDGTTDWIRWKVRPWRRGDDSIGGVILLAESISPLKQAERALRASEERLRLITDLVPYGIFAKDSAGRYIFANRALASGCGFSVEEIIGKDDFDLVADRAQAEAYRADDLAVIRSGSAKFIPEESNTDLSGHTRFLQTTKIPFTVPDTGEPAVLGVWVDISERKRTEESLSRFAAIINSSDDAIISKTPDGLITSWNPGAEEIFGYTAKEMIGRSMMMLIPPERMAEEAAILARIARGESISRFETVRFHKDGRRIDISASISPVKESSGRIVGASKIAHDITDRRRAEAALKEKEAQLHAADSRLAEIVHGMNEACFALDRDWRFTFVNDRCQTLFRHTREEMLGRSIWDVFARLVGTPMEAKYRRAMAERVPVAFEAYSPIALRWLDIRLFPTSDGLAAFLLDIHERKHAEDRIREQADMLDRAHDAIIVRDFDDGTIRFWNRGAEKLYGWTFAEAVGQRIGELICVDPTAPDTIRDQLAQTDEWHGETRHKTKAGQVLIMQTRATLVRDAAGRAKSVLSINTDMTAQKDLESLFQRAQRMESIGTLAGGIAHDLNNALAPILTSLELLKMICSDPAGLELIQILETSAQHGASMVRQILSFARGMEGPRIEVRVPHLLRDIEKLANETFLKAIRVRVEFPSDLWPVLGDATQLHQVLLNLCVNARDAMPAGGTLTLSAENLTLDAHYAAFIPEANPGPFVALHVEDTGVGMPQDLVEKIFDPFFTTKEVGKGTGLGLSTALGIVRSHGGFIRVDSQPGRGTKFSLYLPAQLEPVSSVVEEKVEGIPRGHGELILVVDDEPSVRRVTQQALEASGYRVVSASDGAEAVAVYMMRKSEINAVILDMMMPVLDGPGAIKVLRLTNPEVRIVAVTGLATNEHASRAGLLGVKHFLAKPYTAENLLKTLQQALTVGG